MIKITYDELKRTPLLHALRRLAEAPLRGKDAYQVAKILKHVEAEVPTYVKLWEKVMSEHAERDEKGEVKTVNDPQLGPNAFTVAPEKQEAFKKACEEFLAITIEIPYPKMHKPIFDHVTLTAREMLALEPILTEVEIAPATKPLSLAN